jgi:hypothetical protein
LGIFILGVSFIFSGEIPSENIKSTQGHFTNYYEKRLMSLKTIEPVGYICLDDGKEYEINSINHQAFNKEKF